jgi:type III secretory pathway component EscR
MNRIAALTLLLASFIASPLPTQAQDTPTSTTKPQSEKSAQKQQKALYNYQQKQAKAQQKTQRKSDKQQQKAAKKYEKQQRKQLKNASLPAKHKS